MDLYLVKKDYFSPILKKETIWNLGKKWKSYIYLLLKLWEALPISQPNTHPLVVVVVPSEGRRVGWGMWVWAAAHFLSSILYPLYPSVQGPGSGRQHRIASQYYPA